MEKHAITESFVVKSIVTYLVNKENGNWHEDNAKISNLHEHGPDIILRGGKRNGEHFIIECKGKSQAQSANSVNKEVWLTALGQLLQRITVKRYTISRKDRKTITSINRAYKYGLGLYWVTARVALRRIPREVAEVLSLYIFSVDDDGFVTQFTPKDFGKDHLEEEFHKTDD